MVVTLAPSQEAASVVQALIACPSTCTTQAPHWLVSQPTCVPVRRRFSRRNCTRSVRGSTLPFTGLPFTVIEIAIIDTSRARLFRACRLPTWIDRAPRAAFAGIFAAARAGVSYEITRV